MIISAHFLVYFIGDRIDRIKSIVTDASLEAAACLLAEGAHHLDLLHQVIVAVMYVREAVDFFTCKM